MKSDESSEPTREEAIRRWRERTEQETKEGIIRRPRRGKNDNGKEEGWGELSQTRAAIWSAVGIIFFVDLFTIVLSVVVLEEPKTYVFGTEYSLIGSIVIDLFLGINLLRGKHWARTWTLIRLVSGLLIWGIIAIAQQDFISFVMQVGVCGALILLLTGASTRIRVAGAIGVWLVIWVGGVIWASIPQSAEKVENYVNTSVDGFNVAVPSDWIKDEEVGTEYELAFGQVGLIASAEFYTDASESAGLVLIIYNMEETYEIQGELWSGWQHFVETEGISKRDISINFSSPVMMEAENVVRKDTNQIIVGDNDAYEVYYTADIEFLLANFYFLVVFGEDELGIVCFFCTEEAHSTLQKCWTEIRDSVSLY